MRRKANTEFEKYFLKIKTKNHLSWGMALVFLDLNSVISTPTTSSNKFKRNKRRHSGKKNLSTPMPTTSSNKCKALSNLDGDWISSDEEAQEVEALIQQAIQGRGQTRNIKCHTSTSGGMQSNCIILSKGACPRQAIDRSASNKATNFHLQMLGVSVEDYDINVNTHPQKHIGDDPNSSLRGTAPNLKVT